jgi:hypothetical protein
MSVARKLLPPAMRVIHGASSWRIANNAVEAWLTQDGGHLGPVSFKTPLGVIQPFSVAPWLPREVGNTAPGVLRNLRGDFFCLPFGDSGTSWRRENHPLHGETAQGRWRRVSCVRFPSATELVTQMKLKIRPGLVTKRIRIVSGQTVVYISHEISGMEGPMSLGHHAMLRFPDDEGSGHITCSGFRFGQVRPSGSQGSISDHSRLRSGATFRSLRRVPQKVGDYADLTRFPGRLGFDDLVLLATRRTQPLAWFTATFPKQRYLWFSLKNPRQLVSTLLWYSNGGYQGVPWNGRHRPVMGIEEITGYFDFGLKASVRTNPLSRKGVPTALELKAGETLRIPYVMGVVTLPRGFDWVSRVRFGPGYVVFTSNSKITVRQAVDWHFFSETPLASPAALSTKHQSRGLNR